MKASLLALSAAALRTYAAPVSVRSRPFTVAESAFNDLKATAQVLDPVQVQGVSNTLSNALDFNGLPLKRSLGMNIPIQAGDIIQQGQVPSSLGGSVELPTGPLSVAAPLVPTAVAIAKNTAGAAQAGSIIVGSQGSTASSIAQSYGQAVAQAQDSVAETTRSRMVGASFTFSSGQLSGTPYKHWRRAIDVFAPSDVLTDDASGGASDGASGGDLSLGLLPPPQPTPAPQPALVAPVGVGIEKLSEGWVGIKRGSNNKRQDVNDLTINGGVVVIGDNGQVGNDINIVNGENGRAGDNTETEDVSSSTSGRIAGSGSATVPAAVPAAAPAVVAAVAPAVAPAASLGCDSAVGAPNGSFNQGLGSGPRSGWAATTSSVRAGTHHGPNRYYGGW